MAHISRLRHSVGQFRQEHNSLASHLPECLPVHWELSFSISRRCASAILISKHAAKHVGCQFRNPDDCWDMDSQRTFRESPQICITPPESCPFRTTVVRGNPIRFSDPGIWSKSRIGYAAGYFDSWSYTIVLYSQLIKSVNRLIAIVRPAFYYYRCNIPNTQKVILFVWIASALECAPQAFGKCRWHLKF